MKTTQPTEKTLMKKQIATKTWLLSMTAFVALSLAACGGGGGKEKEKEEKMSAKKEEVPALKTDAPEPTNATQQDRERGWKLVGAGVVGVAGTRGSSSSSLSNDPNRYSGSNTTAHALHGTADALGFLSLLLGSVGSSAKSTIHADIYFFEPVEALFCQLYYNGNKAKKRGTKIGVLKTLPDKRSKKTGLIKGLLSFDMKGPGKKNPPPMRVVCAGDKKDLPKKLPLEVSENLQAVDVFAKR